MEVFQDIYTCVYFVRQRRAERLILALAFLSPERVLNSCAQEGRGLNVPVVSRFLLVLDLCRLSSAAMSRAIA